ncbi:hypothetical protein [Thalassospira sp.]|uniref:hypothetical protein n=1 Tax=Thalassospira sp. TaxID=1912094 RepID=UPI0032F0105A
MIPFAKIDDETLGRIMQGFCCAEPIADIAHATGVSAKTCRSIILALRFRLFEERFDHWREARFLRTSLDPKLEMIVQATVYGCLARCYFNRSCYTNYQQGRRQARQCKSCPVRTLGMGADYDDILLYHIDLIHGLYAVLGIGGERNVGKLTLFRLRLAHTQVVGEACEATRRLRDDTPDFTDESPRTVRMLHAQIIRSLEQQPLTRRMPELNPALAPFEDLTFLE